ncbi:HB2L protein, partial [Vireo altiloquus]|nr:HB2L protein [Vireo altiloquus]
PELCPAHTEVFQELLKDECHFINGTENVRFVQRQIYNREQYLMFDSDVGNFVGDTPYGEKLARCANSKPEYYRSVVDWFCRVSYELYAPFSVER